MSYLTPKEQLIILFIITALVVGATVQWYRSGREASGVTNMQELSGESTLLQ